MHYEKIKCSVCNDYTLLSTGPFECHWCYVYRKECLISDIREMLKNNIDSTGIIRFIDEDEWVAGNKRNRFNRDS